MSRTNRPALVVVSGAAALSFALLGAAPAHSAGTVADHPGCNTQGGVLECPPAPGPKPE